MEVSDPIPRRHGTHRSWGRGSSRSLGIGGMQLFRAEVPGPQTDKLAPRIGETAKLLWRVYLLLGDSIYLLAIGGMDTFDAVCHTFTTMATGGFSTRAMSIACQAI